MTPKGRWPFHIRVCPECKHPVVALRGDALAAAQADHASWHRAPELFKTVVRAGNERKVS